MKKRFFIPLIALLNVCAGYLIYYTAHLGSTGEYNDWTKYNLSVVGYWDGHERELIIWGLITAAVFVAFLLMLWQLSDRRPKAVLYFSIAAGAFLSVGVFVPYQHEAIDSIISNIHIACSFNAPMCVAIALILLTVRQLKTKSGMILMVFLVAGLGGAALIFIKYTIITTVLELYTISALTAYMDAMAAVLFARKAEKIKS